jgi:hypothetical protein
MVESEQMSKYRVGDRVRCLKTKRVGTVISDYSEYDDHPFARQGRIAMQWDDRRYSAPLVADLEKVEDGALPASVRE